MFKLACRDLGVDCDFVASARTVGEVKRTMIAHAAAVHADLHKNMSEAERVQVQRLVDARITFEAIPVASPW